MADLTRSNSSSSSTESNVDNSQGNTLDSAATSVPSTPLLPMPESPKTKRANAKDRSTLDSLLTNAVMYARQVGGDMVKDMAERSASTSAPPPSDPSSTNTRTGRSGLGASKQITTPPKKKKSISIVPKSKKSKVDLDEVVHQGEMKAEQPIISANQPKLVTGAVMKDYQLVGTSWLISLFKNGLNGILADEMGLGKTLQTIAYIAFLIENGVPGPYLVVAPTSVISNWVSEFEKFAPTIPTLLYYGTIEERAELRATRLGLSGALVGRKGKGKQRASTSSSAPKSIDFERLVVVTSYNMIINDRPELAKINYGLIVTDEAHRIKNFQCELIIQLKQYPSGQRLLLTGTPLHNNLSELWSLLSYIMPAIFNDVELFKRWFDLSSATTAGGGINSSILSTVEKLHGILKPFMLRRLKVDVEKNLPLKKEYILSAPLTPQQKDLYDSVVARTIRTTLMSQKLAAQGISQQSEVITIDDDSDSEIEIVDASSAVASTSAKRGRMRDSTTSARPDNVRRTSGARTKKRARKSYVELEDDEYFDALNDFQQEDGEMASNEEIGREYGIKVAKTSINNLKLNNIVMQLRKVCNHPFVFDWPIDPKTGTGVVDDRLLAVSGKMLLLDRLLEGLFAQNRKVLLFSQFTSQLDIIHDWATEHKEWPVYRIDGSTKIAERASQMKAFNEDDPTEEGACRLFLLSTRAGGVGVTLTGADTVIIFDSDWNPQQDLQAMDRAHRIGQKNPVLVFRLVTANTIEEKILEKAAAKRKLETLIIGQGTFKMDDESMAATLTGRASTKSNEATLLESIAQSASMITLAQKGDIILSDSQLARLLDRSDETMRSKKGWEEHAEGAGEDGEGIGMVVGVAEDIARVDEEELDDQGELADNEEMFI